MGKFIEFGTSEVLHQNAINYFLHISVACSLIYLNLLYTFQQEYYLIRLVVSKHKVSGISKKISKAHLCAEAHRFAVLY